MPSINNFSSFLWVIEAEWVDTTAFFSQVEEIRVITLQDTCCDVAAESRGYFF